jgi:hypothetical protein
VEVDPVVIERLRLTCHQGDEAEVAVAKSSGSRKYLRRSCRLHAQDEGTERNAGDDGVDLVLLRVPVRSHDDAANPLTVVADSDARVLQSDWNPERLDPVLELLPHLSWPEPRVTELLDQRRHMLSPEPQDREECVCE